MRSCLTRNVSQASHLRKEETLRCGIAERVGGGGDGRETGGREGGRGGRHTTVSGNTVICRGATRLHGDSAFTKALPKAKTTLGEAHAIIIFPF